MHHKALTLLISVGIIPFMGCRKLLQVPPPQDEISMGQVFTTEANVNTAMSGLYINMMDNPISICNGGPSLLCSLSADDLSYTGSNSNFSEFYTNSIGTKNDMDSLLYAGSYTYIFDANSVIDGVGGSQLDTLFKAQINAECKFNRAFIYFYLVNLYGNIPLVLTTDFTVSDTIGRTPTQQVYAQIISDLQEAEKNLPADYVTSPIPHFLNDRTRPNSAAASALLSRVYLFLGNWANAEAEATKVISNNNYKLEPNLDSVFLETSKEAIWQLQPVYKTTETLEGWLFQPSQASIPTYPLTNTLQTAFEPGDQRQVHWTGLSLVNGESYLYPFKYKQNKFDTISFPDPEYETVLRLGEVYLIRAESRARQGNLTGAAEDVNMIRSRASLPQSPADNLSSLLTAILHENQIEFFGEWGHRWLDLKRLDLTDQILGNEKVGWKNTDVLYPFPLLQLIYNPNLLQNPGY